jgi:selenophosphate synthetase-related protein
MVHSGLPFAEWKALYISTELSVEMKKFEGLKKCCEKKALTFKDLKEVVEKENIRTAHTICEVRLI